MYFDILRHLVGHFDEWRLKTRNVFEYAAGNVTLKIVFNLVMNTVPFDNQAVIVLGHSQVQW